MKPGNPPLQSIRLLDQMRERIRSVHYSLSTETVYLYWVRFFIRWHGRGGQMKHPRTMGAPEIEAFLSMLATERKVSASTHNQALSALLCLYREVLGIDLPWLNDINRPACKRRIPSVLTNDEVAGVLPRSLVPALRMQLLSARAIWEVDRQAQRGGVETPHALAAKYPKVGSTWAWFCMFPSPTLSIDPRSGVERRHHLYEDRLQRALKRAVREAEIANVPFLGALAGGSARRSERRVASHTSEEQRRNAPGSAAKNRILAFSASLMQAGISKPVSVHTLRHSFATHLLQGAARFRERQGTLQSRRIKRKIDRPVP